MSDKLYQVAPILKHGVDAGAAGIAWTAFFTDIMPAIAVTLSVIWISLQIFTWVLHKKWRE